MRYNFKIVRLTLKIAPQLSQPTWTSLSSFSFASNFVIFSPLFPLWSASTIAIKVLIRSGNRISRSVSESYYEIQSLEFLCESVHQKPCFFADYSSCYKKLSEVKLEAILGLLNVIEFGRGGPTKFMSEWGMGLVRFHLWNRHKISCVADSCSYKVIRRPFKVCRAEKTGKALQQLNSDLWGLAPLLKDHIGQKSWAVPCYVSKDLSPS